MLKLHPLFCAFLTGYITLSLEILAPRLIGVYFGITHITWTLNIFVFLTGLFTGYLISSFYKINIKIITFLNLMAVLLIFTYQLYFKLLLSINISFELKTLFGMFLFLPCSITLGYLSPYYVEVMKASPRRSSGIVSGFITAGGLIGCLITGLYLFSILNNIEIIIHLGVCGLIIFISSVFKKGGGQASKLA